MQKRNFIGGTDIDLINSLVESFIYEENLPNCEQDEIRATVAHKLGDGQIYVDYGFYTKESLLERADLDPQFYITNDCTKDECKELGSAVLFSALLAYYGPPELGFFSTFLISTLEEWYEHNKESLSFELSECLEYFSEMYG